MQTGIFYIATGENYVQEAIESAKSVKAHMPEMPIAMATEVSVDSPYIDTVIPVDNPNYGFRDKVNFMRLSPYQNTLFLDTDTYICGTLYELFDLLERFDVGLIHDGGFLAIHFDDVPDSFPQFNSGVILFRKDKIDPIFHKWIEHYDKLVPEYDPSDRRASGWGVEEATLRRLIYQSDVHLAPIPSLYNCRFIEGGYVTGFVKILHRHSTYDFETVAKAVNLYQGQRVYIANRVMKHKVVGRILRRVVVKNIARYDQPIHQMVSERFMKYYKKGGIKGILQEITQRLRK